MLPKITVITPSYNQGQFIEQTIQSVLTQQYPQLEYIIVDGASTDETLATIGPYVGQLTLLSEPDTGQSDAINKGLKIATGDIVCWLNSDDCFMPDTLNFVGAYFAAQPDCLWITGDCSIINSEGISVRKPIRRYKRLLRSLFPSAYLGFTNAICQPSTFWRRSVHEKLGFLDERLQFTMDYDLWLRLASRQKPYITSNVLSAFRIHAQSKGVSSFTQQSEENLATVSRYYSSRTIRKLHQWHNEVIVKIYRLIN
ncbi:MAG: glycosyltransferase [Cytophagales bacterium]|nr:MAG: glycosyltransferase [Cytophagales bacterium]